ncbi:TPA: hypothetical protein KQF29_002205 [Clostridioides difficile]|nr:hypothetical protein [Clostridioides difficile]
MNIDFSTILDLKVNKENVKMIEKEINKINNDIFDISLKDCANGHVGCVKEISGKSLKIETWSHGEISSRIGIRLKFEFYYSKGDKVDIENIENILIYVNSLCSKNIESDLIANIRPRFYKLEEEYSTRIEKCEIRHEFIGINKQEIKEFLEYLTKIEKSERTVVYKNN